MKKPGRGWQGNNDLTAGVNRNSKHFFKLAKQNILNILYREGCYSSQLYKTKRVFFLVDVENESKYTCDKGFMIMLAFHVSRQLENTITAP